MVTEMHGNVVCLVVVGGVFKVNESYSFCQNRITNKTAFVLTNTAINYRSL